jgi:streptogramin lyase
MKGFAAVALVVALGLLGCGGTAASEGGPSRHDTAEFHDPLLGISAQVPPGWSTRHARFGGGQLREDLSAASFPIDESSSLRTAVCRSDGSFPPPGGVGVLLYEHPALNGVKVNHLKGWFPPRPARSRLGKPGNEEGYYGFNIFFQDRRRALQAQVCLHRGSPFTERSRRQVEHFLDSLRFSRPGSQLIGHGTARSGCHAVFAGSGEPGWRRQATAAGPFGFSGAGREFLRIPHRERDGLFHTKMPALVEGHRSVELSVPTAERDRVGIEVVAARHPVDRVIFTPCEDKPRTIWAAGLALRDRAPVTLVARVGARVLRLRLGRVARRHPAVRSTHIGGRRPKLVVGRGSLWALTCESGCTAKSRPSSTRIVRIDPDSGRVIASARLRRGSDLVVGAEGVYVIDFWSGAVRRLDPRTLRVTAELRLRLPFEVEAGPDGRDFLPIDAVEADESLWVSTDRGVLARVGPDLGRVIATVRLPFDAGGGIAAGDGAVWTAQQLAGVYRVDPRTNRVVARIKVGPRPRRLAFQDVAVGGREVFALGVRTGRHRVSSGEEVLVRIDPSSDRVEAVTSLPRGAGTIFTYGAGALWVVGENGSEIYRIDPSTGKVTDRVDGTAIVSLAVSAARVWSASVEGVLRRLPNS